MGTTTLSDGAIPEQPIPSLAERCSERARSSQGRALYARAQRPFTARTALREFPREGRAPYHCSHE